MSVKNMVIGSPLHSVAGETPVWHDKHLFHAEGGRRGNYHAMNYNMAIAAKKLSTNWGAALIDGFEGMEGNGPSGGTPVPMHVAIASPDYIAADSVALETMGIPAHAVGYLQYAAQIGTGQFDLAKIDIRGERPESVRRVFKLHDQIQQELDWLREMRPA
jgi:uncharacterized protein (DUF362 family)